MAADVKDSGSGTPTAQVRIGRVAVRGFRCLGDMTIELEPTTTYLVGENNMGKTSLLLAISAALGRSRPTTDDLTRGADGVHASQAEVDLFVFPAHGEAFGAHERGAFGGNVHRMLGEATEFVGIRSRFLPSLEGGQLLVDRSYLQPGRDGLVESATEFHASALKVFECEMLDASRDLVADLGSGSSRWGRVLFDLQIPELPPTGGAPNPLSRSTLEGTLRQLAEDTRQASPVLSQLEADLG